MDGNNIPLPLLALFSPLAGGFRPSELGISGFPLRRWRERREPPDATGPRLARRSVVDRRVLGGVRAELEGLEGAAEEIGMAERLTDVFVGGGDEDLLIQRSDQEDRVLQALDMQVVGACRADERLKPLLKSSGSSSATKDRLLAHFSRNEIMMTVFPMFQQHIEPHLVHAHDLTNGKDTLVPVFDFQHKRCVGSKTIKSASSGVIRRHIEPDLHHAQSPDSFPAEVLQGNEAQTDNFIEMYLRPPSANEEARINDWIKVCQSGIRYYLSLGDQRIVDKHFIIRPKAEFEVGRMTLGGLLALGYTVVVSYKRAPTFVSMGNLSTAFKPIDSLSETFMVLRGTNRNAVGAEHCGWV
ncbi:hypothetical protein NL676_007164 [Syzygium grande]|nr:hypothetical protein NL676_007164 [Syzygium grande]